MFRDFDLGTQNFRHLSKRKAIMLGACNLYQEKTGTDSHPSENTALGRVNTTACRQRVEDEELTSHSWCTLST